jgi:hypothetical protein
VLLKVRFSGLPVITAAKYICIPKSTVMQQKDYYHPDSQEFYQAHTPRESALLQLVLQRQKITFTKISFHDQDKFVERYYVKNKRGHLVANECMILDLEIQDGRDKNLVLEFANIVDELRKYYEQKFE